jgi:tetratricopeptide (TPR) repeat protein
VAQSRIDSLNTQLAEAVQVEKRIELFSDISEYYFDTQIYLDSSFFYAEKAYNLAKKEGIDFEQARALFNLGLVRTETDDFDEAIDYLMRSRELTAKLKLTGNLSVISSNIGGLYFEKKDYINAIKNYNEAIAISEDLKDTIGIAIDLLNVGEARYKMGEFLVAKEQLIQSLKLLKIMDLELASGHLNYGLVLFELGDIENAKNEAYVALEIAENDNDLRAIAESSQLLSNIYKYNKDFEKSLEYFNMSVRFKDSLHTAKELNEIEKLKLNFELTKKREELDYLTQKNTYQNTIYVLIASGIVLLLILVFRQLKIVRLTAEMHDVQNRLVAGELKQRELAEENRRTSGFRAALEQDKELLEDD